MLPNRSDGYQLPSFPPTVLNRDLWNAVVGDIDLRLRNREGLEATFEDLIAQGTQASLDYIQINVGPQIAVLQATIAEAQEQIDAIFDGGNAPNALKLGGQLPAYYASAEALADGLSGKVSGVFFLETLNALLDDAPAGLNTLGKLSAALGDDPTFSQSVLDRIAEAEIALAEGLVEAGQIARSSGLPIGTIIDVYGNGTAVIPGYLKVIPGLEVTNTYPELRAFALANGWPVNGAGNPVMPAGDALFKRQWRAGQVRDAGRVFGSVQEDALQNITGNFQLSTASPAAGVAMKTLSAFTGAFKLGADRGQTQSMAVGAATGGATDLAFDASGSARTATETRPANLTVTYYIKAYGADVDQGSIDVAKLADDIAAVAARTASLEAKKGGTTGRIALANNQFDVTSIPADARSIKVKFAEASVSAPGVALVVQLGTAAGVDTAGYKTSAAGQSTTGTGTASYTTDVRFAIYGSSTGPYSGVLILDRVGNTNEWLARSQMKIADAAGALGGTAAYKLLAGTLDRVRIASGNGTATLAGNVEVEWGK